MGDQKKLFIRLELLWWLITAVTAFTLLLPIYLEVEHYPFWGTNLFFVVTFITFFRLIFLLPYTLIANNKIAKLVLIFFCFLMVFILTQEVNHFQVFLDEQGQEAVLGKMPLNQQNVLINYIRNEMLILGIGSIIGSIVLPIVLIKSIWHDVNTSKTTNE